MAHKILASFTSQSASSGIWALWVIKLWVIKGSGTTNGHHLQIKEIYYDKAFRNAASIQRGGQM